MPASLGTLSAANPVNCLRTFDGAMLIANGLDAVKRWNGLSSSYDNAGIPAGGSALTMGSSGAGALSGTYKAYYRYVDADGTPGNLSTATAEVTVTSKSQIDYSSIPGTAPDARVTKVQVFRNTSGQYTTFYLDAEVNIGTTTATSTKSDTTLSQQTALPIFNPDGTLHANRFGVPPSAKSVLAVLQDRVFYAVDVPYSDGHVVVTNASTTVTGKNTAFTSAMVGRYLYVVGHGTKYLISSVDTGAQTLTLSTAFTGTTDSFGLYAIAADPETINAVYYSEILEPESVPVTQNVLYVDDECEGDDYLTGMMRHGSMLYLMKQRRMYRLSFVSAPVEDGGVVEAFARGAINQRCWVRVEDVTYIMDFQGIYAFNGGSIQPISLPIHDWFEQPKVNWARRRYFFAEADQVQNVVRFHVCVNSAWYPDAAICYNYRLNRWWIEEYAMQLGHSCQVQLGNRWRDIYGSQYHKFSVPHNGLDGMLSGSPEFRSQVTSATMTSLTDGAVTHPSTVVNCDVVIVSGRGAGQRRRIVSVSGGRLNVKHPWNILPDATSLYQIGGVPWRIRIDKFQAPELESKTKRSVCVYFTPTKNAASLTMRNYRGYQDAAERSFSDVSDGYGYRKAQSTDTIIDMKKARANKGTHAGNWCMDVSDGIDARVTGDSTIDVELAGVRGADPHKIHKLVMEGLY